MKTWEGSEEYQENPQGAVGEFIGFIKIKRADGIPCRHSEGEAFTGFRRTVGERHRPEED